MRRIVFRSLLVCLLFVIPGVAQHVDEAASNARIEDRSVVISLSVDGVRRGDNLTAKVELVDTRSEAIAADSRILPAIAGGRQVVTFSLPLEKVLARPNEDLAWYRVRYAVG